MNELHTGNPFRFRLDSTGFREGKRNGKLSMAIWLPPAAGCWWLVATSVPAATSLFLVTDQSVGRISSLIALGWLGFAGRPHHRRGRRRRAD